MEQGTVVAIVALAGSFLTVVVTSASNYFIKKLDAEQKVNEHKLSIRSSYINKKIEAGQIFISNSNVKINSLNLTTGYWIIVKTKYHKDTQLLERINKTEESILDHRLSVNDWTNLYYDLDDFYDQVYKITQELNILFKDYDEEYESSECTSEKIDEIINNILHTAENLQLTYRYMNKVVRSEISKYDII